MFEHDGAKPSCKGCRLPQRGQSAIDLAERLLRGVLGKMMIAQDRSGIGDGDVLVSANQFGECEVVTRLDATYPRCDPFSPSQTPSIHKDPVGTCKVWRPSL